MSGKCGPYRATALWNEAVIMFRDEMELGEHRHRLHKHQNSFSGRSAVSTLLSCLRSNALFNPGVSREQTTQLLRQFLKADLIAPVANCSLASPDFIDSHKHLYQFTEKLLGFQRLTPLNSKPSSSGSSPHGPLSDSYTQKENFLNSNAEKSWKLAVIQRIVELLQPFDVSDLIPYKDINSKWVATNANPEWSKLKWNTELPHWILSTIQQLFEYSSQDKRERAYPTFHMDAFHVISDYLKTLENSLILQCFYKLFIEIFKYFEYLNTLENVNDVRMGMSSSQEDLICRISSPIKSRSSTVRSLCNDRLPPNHCYEAAFISDDPTFRVRLQSSVDSVHLQKISQVSEGSLQTKNPKTKNVPLKTIDNNIQRNLPESKSGFVNEGFTIFSPQKRHSPKNRHFHKYSSHDCLNVKSDHFRENDMLSSHGGYVNHGLSFSLEDMSMLENHLDYDFALESLEKLMKVSKYNASTSDDDYSFHTALSTSGSEADVSETPELDYCERLEVHWNDRILLLGVSVFQLLLMLLPPCNRAILKNLAVLMNDVLMSSSLPGFSLPYMLQELSKSILRPQCDTIYFSSKIEQRLLVFIVSNHTKIFSELPNELLSVINNDIYERQLQVLSYCKQITEEQFEKQKTEESNVALMQLLDHILSNNAISERERKKHLKVFKESYPAIYKLRFPTESCQVKSNKILFSFKNFRL